MSSTSSDATPQQLWPIGQNTDPLDNDDILVHRPEASIFHDELATSRNIGDSDSARPMSMFDVPADVHTASTATMSTDEERAPASMSDEARTAMKDITGNTPPAGSSFTDRVQLATTVVPLAKVANEPQADRHTTSKPMMTIFECDETVLTKHEGRGDAWMQAASSLYPGRSGGPSKTLLDYYSARAAERRSDQPTRRQYEQPRVTLSFFPSRGNDEDQSTSSGTSKPPPTITDEKPSTEQPQQPAGHQQSADDGLQTTTVDPGQPRPLISDQGESVETTTTTGKPGRTSKSVASALIGEATAADTKQTTLAHSNRPALKPVDRRSSEPLTVTGHETRVRGQYNGSQSNNSWDGAATGVFMSNVLSYLLPTSQTTEKDWGHFTLVKPAKHGAKANKDKQTPVTNGPVKR